MLPLFVDDWEAEETADKLTIAQVPNTAGSVELFVPVDSQTATHTANDANTGSQTTQQPQSGIPNETKATSSIPQETQVPASVPKETQAPTSVPKETQATASVRKETQAPASVSKETQATVSIPVTDTASNTADLAQTESEPVHPNAGSSSLASGEIVCNDTNNSGSARDESAEPNQSKVADKKTESQAKLLNEQVTAAVVDSVAATETGNLGETTETG